VTHRPLRRTLLSTCVAAFAAFAAAPAAAWTDKPVRLIVPAPAGGTMDVIARVLAEQLATDLGAPVIVDNKPGGGGVIGIQALLQAPADGQTLMVTVSNVLTEIPHVIKTPYDPLADVRPIAAIARATMVMIGGPGFAPSDLKAVIDYGKSQGNSLAFASYSTGTSSQYAGMILGQKTGLSMVHVPFAGSPPALQQVMGGHVPVMFDGMVTSLPLIQSGKVKPYAVASATRSPFLPNVPTFAELGYPEMAFGNWAGVVAASKLPAALVERVNAAVLKAAASPKVRERLGSAGFELGTAQSSDALAQATRAESERNAVIVKTFDIKL
jgi:tripartite-type tricarboxylate transporter receptor subunit TctC